MKKFLIILCSFVIIPCFAVEWYEIFTKTYIDVDSFKRENGILDFWTKEYDDDGFFKSFSFYDKNLEFAMFHHQISCKDKTHALLRVLTYDKKHRPLRNLEPEHITFSEIIPGSEIDYYTYLCQ